MNLIQKIISYLYLLSIIQIFIILNYNQQIVSLK